MTRKKRPETPPHADGFWWFKNFVSLKQGGHHHEWRICRVLGDGQAEVYGPVLTLDGDDRYLYRAIWGPAISPPPIEGVATALSLVPTQNRQNRKSQQGKGPASNKLLALARQITIAFVESSDDLRAVYAQAPDKLEEVVRRVAGLIEDACG